jgi:hypothetical protein
MDGSWLFDTVWEQKGGPQQMIGSNDVIERQSSGQRPPSHSADSIWFSSRLTLCPIHSVPVPSNTDRSPPLPPPRFSPQPHIAHFKL